jgi:hypothetical protein
MKVKVNKKGQILQVIFIMIVMVGCGVALLINQMVQSKFFEALDEGGLTTTETNITKVGMQNNYSTLDGMMIFVLVGLTIGLLITSFLIPSHPIFMVFNFFGIFFLVFIGMTLSNLYGEMIAGADAPFGVEAESYPATVFIIQYLPWICCIIVFLSTVIMFAKGQGGSGM